MGWLQQTGNNVHIGWLELIAKTKLHKSKTMCYYKQLELTILYKTGKNCFSNRERERALQKKLLQEVSGSEVEANCNYM